MMFSIDTISRRFLGTTESSPQPIRDQCMRYRSVTVSLRGRETLTPETFMGKACWTARLAEAVKARGPRTLMEATRPLGSTVKLTRTIPCR